MGLSGTCLNTQLGMCPGMCPSTCSSTYLQGTCRSKWLGMCLSMFPRTGFLNHPCRVVRGGDRATRQLSKPMDRRLYDRRRGEQWSASQLLTAAEYKADHHCSVEISAQFCRSLSQELEPISVVCEQYLCTTSQRPNYQSHRRRSGVGPW